MFLRNEMQYNNFLVSSDNHNISSNSNMKERNNPRLNLTSSSSSSLSLKSSSSSLLTFYIKFLVLALFLNSTFFGTLNVVNGFNIDIPSVLTHRGPSGSMFGFSVAQHKDSNVSWILVGAPAADSRQPGVSKGGGVYRCSCVTSDTCQLIPFDRTGNNQVDGRQIDEKSGQWFGATVKSSGDDGIILACAPRYTWFSANKKRRDPVGTCFIAKDSFTEFTEYSPCRTPRWGYHRQGSCQLGLGADVDSAGRRTFLGAVGSWYWQGQVFMVDSRKAAGDQSKVPFYQFIPPGQLYSQSVASRPDIRWTREGPSWDDDSYLGYSIATGEFSGDGDSDVAVGMPRGNNLTGRELFSGQFVYLTNPNAIEWPQFPIVVIYSSDLTNLHNVSGEQIGAYFGYCIAVLDVDGDGLDDLVIGAPMYTDFQDPAMKIETGRVYVVYQNRRRKFKEWDSIDGTTNKGRFGLSICSLGDINRDGYDDFAVGAPYDGLDGNGAVYIYQGTKEHIPTKREYTQVIYSSALPYQVSTFGFSLSGGKDLDGNSYSDLIVGAYDSDVIAYFRSRPVVQVRSKLTFTVGKQINLDEKRCTLSDRTRVSCFNLTLCMSYEGFGADDIIDFNVQTILDSKKVNEHRLFFLDHENAHVMNSTLQLRKSTQRCIPTRVYIKSSIRDKLTSLDADLYYSMIEKRARHLSPVIDVTASTKEKASVSIQKNCGTDNICVPDLRLKVLQSSETYVFGSQQNIWLDIELYNNGEHSFESAVYVQVPQGLGYVTFDRQDTDKDLVILCSPPKPENNNTIKCDMGNPLPTFTKAKVRLNFKPLVDSEIKSDYEFTVIANSTNPEKSTHLHDNFRSPLIRVHVDTSLSIIGTSKHQPVIHNVSLYRIEKKKNESHVGPEVIHVYEVKCGGPSRIEEANVDILWPSFTKDGQNFLYLLEEPDVDVVDPASKTTASCETVGNEVNPLGLKIQRYLKTVSSSVESGTRGGEGSDGRRVDGGGYSYSSSETVHGKDGTSGTYTKTFRNYSSSTTHTRTESHGGGGRGVSSGFGETSVGRGASSSSSSSYGSSSSSGTQYGGGTSYRPGTSYDSGRTTYERAGSTTLGGGSSSHSSGSSYERSGTTTLIHPGTTTLGSGQSTYDNGRGHSSYGSTSSSSSYDNGRGQGSYYGPSQYDNGRGTTPAVSTSSRNGFNSHYGPGAGNGFGSAESEEDNNYLDYGNGNGGRRRRPQDNLLSRHQRDTDSEIEKEYEDEVADSCPDAKCIRIRCNIKSLPSDQSVFFTLRGRVYSDTFREKFPGVNVNVTSKLLSRVTKLPYNVSPAFLGYKSATISTTIEESETIFKPRGIPWWLILLAVLAGIIILLLLVYCLYKCGFFKRRRPQTGPEAQPLHRNGR